MVRKSLRLPTKLTCPRLYDPVVRERLYEALDAARAHPVVWISGPPGAGKTTLAAAYLQARRLPALWYQLDSGDADPAAFLYVLGLGRAALKPPPRRPLPTFTAAHQLNLAGFARAYFRAFCAEVPPRFVLLLDNYHELPENSPVHLLLSEGLKEIPASLSVVVLSRGEAPKEFAALQAAQAIATLGFDSLRFSAEEAQAFARSAAPALDAAHVRRLHADAEGWAAGIVLLFEHLRRFGGVRDGTSNLSLETLFHYFATEVFDGLSPSDRSFLLTSVFLPRMTAETAQALTGRAEAASLLEALHRRQLFTDRRDVPHATYQFHALFRQFLLDRAQRDLDPEQRALLQQHAAELMEASGDIEDAIELNIAARRLDAAVHLIQRHGSALYHRGRRGAMLRWITAVPDDIRLGSGWLLYWLSVALVGIDPGASTRAMQGAYQRFAADGDAVGRLCAAGAALLAYFIFDRGNLAACDRWRADAQELLAARDGRVPIDIEYDTLYGLVPTIVHRQPRSADVATLAARLLELIERLPAHLDPLRGLSVVAMFCRLSGDIELGQRLPRLAEPALARAGDANAKLWWWVHNATLRCYLLGECAPADELPFDRALALLENEGLAFAVPVLQVYRLGVLTSRGDIRAATALREQIERTLDARNRFDLVQLRTSSAHLDLLAGDSAAAQVAAASAVAIAKENGLVALQAQALLMDALTHTDDRSLGYAHASLAEARALVDNPFFSFNCGLAAAYLALRDDDAAQAASSLAASLAIGRERGYRNTWFWLPRMMSRLCAHALESDIETQYVKALIRQRGLRPPDAGAEAWPWPIRLYTLGRFSVVVDDEPLRFQGKTQKRPLELLKAILARGGRAVDQEALAALLWPDLDGDAARNAFDLALHRLRKLIRHEDAIRVQDGKLELNTELVWSDTWAFERAVGGAPGGAEDRAHIDRLLRLYPGHFLSGEEAPWMAPARERLRSKFMRSISAWAQRLQRAGHWDRAISLYRRAIELDPLGEEFHAGLMECLARQDRVAEAIDAYRHCRELLSITLGVEPSPATQALYRQLGAR